MTPRGIRVNNPGNIRKGEQWIGLSDIQLDPDFATFKTPEYGIRAMAKILMNYQIKYKLKSISEIIDRWAPPSENDTNSYVSDVCKRVGKTADEAVNTRDPSFLTTLVTAIIIHENGQCPYDDKVVYSAVVRLFGDDVPKVT